MSSVTNAAQAAEGQRFRYDERVASAIIPALLVFATMADAPVLAMLVVGLLVAYMLDASRQKELALAAVWGTLALSGSTDSIAILAAGRHSDVSLRLAVIFTCLSTLFLTGCWASLQFRFLPLQYPVLAHAAENILLTASGPTAAALLSAGAVASAGPAAAPFYTACICAALTAVFVPPLPPSFRTRGRSAARSAPALGGKTPAGPPGAPTATVQSAGQAGIVALCLTVQPTLLYIGINFRNILHAEHLWSVALLASGSVLFLHLCPKALWWMPDMLYWPRAISGVLAFIVGVAALEKRVVAVAFGAYVKLHAPWSWVVVTIGLYLGAALVIAYFGGLLPLVDPGIVGVVCIAVCTAGGLSIGLPLHILPFALFAGAGLALYQESENLAFYAAFVVGLSVCGGYFLQANFWFLDIAIGGAPLQVVLVTIGLAFVPALLLPALVRATAATADGFSRLLWLNMILIQQGNLVLITEELLFVGDSGESFYPPYLVITTSIMGIVLARRLAQWRLLHWPAYHFMHCVYIGKLFMLALPEARMAMPLTLLLLTATPPLFIPLRNGAPDFRSREALPVPPGSKPGPFGTPLGGVDAARAATPRSVVAAFSGLLFCGQIATVALSRLAVFDTVAALWGGPPPEGVLLGALLAVAAATAAPLVYTWFPHSVTLKRGLFLLVAAAATLATVRPPVPIAGGAACPRLPFKLCPRLWDERHVPAHEADDVELYGEGLVWRENWPLWLLVLSIALAGLAGISVQRGRRNLQSQLVLAVLAALSAGTYLALEFLPGQTLVQPFIVAGTVAAAALLVVVNSPSLLHGTPGAASHLALLPLAWVLCFALALVLQLSVPLPPLPPEAERLMPDVSEEEVAEERRGLAVAAVAAVAAAQGLLVALALKLRIAAVTRGVAAGGAGAGSAGGLPGRRVRAGTAAYASGAGRRGGAAAAAAGSPLLAGVIDQGLLDAGARMMQLDARGSAAMARLSAAGLAWMPTFANITVLITFTLALILNFQIAEGKDEAVLMLAPLLLLLNQDAYILPMIDDRRRYFPPYVALVAYLALSVLRTALDALRAAQPVAAARLVASVLCTLPNHALFAAYLWSQRRQSEWPLLVFTPLNAFPAFFMDYHAAVVWLAGIAAVAAVAQGAAMRQVRRAGTRLI
eukprot:jgi/Ulvmu1/12589/UM092_0019.1